MILSVPQFGVSGGQAGASDPPGRRRLGSAGGPRARARSSLIQVTSPARVRRRNQRGTPASQVTSRPRRGTPRPGVTSSRRAQWIPAPPTELPESGWPLSATVPPPGPATLAERLRVDSGGEATLAERLCPGAGPGAGNCHRDGHGKLEIHTVARPSDSESRAERLGIRQLTEPAATHRDCHGPGLSLGLGSGSGHGSPT